MADSTIDSDNLILKDGFPEGHAIVGQTPIGGFTGSSHHNVATAAYKPGTKIRVYNEGDTGQAGWSTFVYAKLNSAADTPAAKQICVADDGKVSYELTNDDADDIPQTGRCAIMISAMTAGRFGWFWCGGVCPEEYVSALGGNYRTSNAVVAGPIAVADANADDLSASGVPAGDLCFAPAIDADTAVRQAVVGEALAADAA